MIIPTPLDPSSGDKLSAAAFDAGVRDVFNFLLNTFPRVHAYDSVGTSIANGATVLLAMAGEVYDTDSMHDTAVNNGRITATTAGLYEFDYIVSLPGSATYTDCSVQARLNSGGSSAGGTNLRTFTFSDGTRGMIVMAFRFCRVMVAGDYIEVFPSQTSGATKVVSNTTLGTRCFARFLSLT